MKKVLFAFLLPFGLSALLWACSTDSSNSGVNTGKEETNEAPKKESAGTMYQASELALLMREMKSELDQEKERLKSGEPFNEELLAKYEGIRTAKPTSKKDTIGPYHGFANSFLQQLAGINEAENPVEHFNLAVQTCVSCHMEYCQGPIPAIKKLKLTVPPSS